MGKGIFAKEEGLEMGKAVDQKRKRKAKRSEPD
jgi:hypothetical protein